MCHITLRPTYRVEKSLHYFLTDLKKSLWVAVFNVFSVIFYISILKPPSELVFNNITVKHYRLQIGLHVVLFILRNCILLVFFKFNLFKPMVR